MSKPQNTPSGQNGNIEEYDLVILGSGRGGTIAAWTFASNGQRVAVIERKYVGGSCPNIACLPSRWSERYRRVHQLFCTSHRLNERH